MDNKKEAMEEEQTSQQILGTLEPGEMIDVNITITDEIISRHDTNEITLNLLTDDECTITLQPSDYVVVSNVKAGVETRSLIYVTTDNGGTILTVSNSEDHPDNTSYIKVRSQVNYSDSVSLVGDFDELEKELIIDLTAAEREYTIDNFQVDQRTVEELLFNGASVDASVSGMVWNPHLLYEQVRKTIPDSVLDTERWNKQTPDETVFDEQKIIDAWVNAYQSSTVEFGFSHTFN